MVVLSEAMSFVADVLQQAQTERVATEPDGLGLTGAVDLFVLLG